MKLILFYTLFATNIIVDDEKASMEVCQQLDKKHEPETSYHTDFDVKHEAHTQYKATVNAREFRPIIGPKINNDIFDEKPKVEYFTCYRQLSTEY